MPIIILIVNNQGYSMIKQTQEQWLNSNFLASSKDKGLGFPDFAKVASAFDIDFFNFNNEKQELEFYEFFKKDIKKPIIINININPFWRVTPQVKYGRPNEDPDPLLDRDIFNEEMLI